MIENVVCDVNILDKVFIGMRFGNGRIGIICSIMIVERVNIIVGHPSGRFRIFIQTNV